MSKSEKLLLYLIIFNAAYFASTEVELLKALTWGAMIGFGVWFVILPPRT